MLMFIYVIDYNISMWVGARAGKRASSSLSAQGHGRLYVVTPPCGAEETFHPLNI